MDHKKIPRKRDFFVGIELMGSVVIRRLNV